MSNPQPALLMGQRKANAKLQALNAVDAFAETVLFGVGTKNESEFVKLWPEGAMLAGIYHGFKTMEIRAGENAPQSYIKLESLDGKKFRAYAPGQLLHRVKDLKPGTYIEATYLGKEQATIEGASRMVHKFDVSAETATH